MDLKTPASTKTTFTIRSPLSIFTFRSKNRDEASRSPPAQPDLINEPTPDQSPNLKRPKKKGSDASISSTTANNACKGSSTPTSKPTTSGGRRSEDLGLTRVRSSLFARSQEKTHSMPGLDEKALQGFLERVQLKNKDNKTFSQDMVSRVSNFFSKFKPSQKGNETPNSGSKSPESKKQIKRVTFAINIHESQNSEEVANDNIMTRKRQTAKDDAENISPVRPKLSFRSPKESLTGLSIENKRPESIASKSTNLKAKPDLKIEKDFKHPDLDIDFHPYGLSPSMLSPLTPSTGSSVSSKTNFMTPLNLGVISSKSPSENGSLSPGKGLSPMNLLPIKANLMFDNKARRGSGLVVDINDDKHDNFDIENEIIRGAVSHRNVVLSSRTQNFNHRVSEVRSSLKLPALSQVKKG